MHALHTGRLTGFTAAPPLTAAPRAALPLSGHPSPAALSPAFASLRRPRALPLHRPPRLPPRHPLRCSPRSSSCVKIRGAEEPVIQDRRLCPRGCMPSSALLRCIQARTSRRPAEAARQQDGRLLLPRPSAKDQLLTLLLRVCVAQRKDVIWGMQVRITLLPSATKLQKKEVGAWGAWSGEV